MGLPCRASSPPAATSSDRPLSPPHCGLSVISSPVSSKESEPEKGAWGAPATSLPPPLMLMHTARRLTTWRGPRSSTRSVPQTTIDMSCSLSGLSSTTVPAYGQGRNIPALPCADCGHHSPSWRSLSNANSSHERVARAGSLLPRRLRCQAVALQEVTINHGAGAALRDSHVRPELRPRVCSVIAAIAERLALAVPRPHI